MRKNRKIIILIMLLMISLLTSCKKNVNIVESFPEKITNLNSYKIVGKLETMFPTGTKECEVTAYYQKPDLFRVEIKNPNVEELQVIIKNVEGVFVIVPSINKTFKVNGTWPINSSYPYLLQSLSKDILSDDAKEITKDETVTKYKLNAQLFDWKVTTGRIQQALGFLEYNPIQMFSSRFPDNGTLSELLLNKLFTWIDDVGYNSPSDQPSLYNECLDNLNIN